MNKNIAIGIVGGLVIGLGAGYFIPHGASAASRPGQFIGQFAGRAAGMGKAGFGGTAGQVLSLDGSTLTIKMQDGSTKLVLIASSTSIMKMAQGSAADLAAGTEVVVSGTSNSDGSITAQSVQNRPQSSQAPMMRAQ